MPGAGVGILPFGMGSSGGLRIKPEIVFLAAFAYSAIVFIGSLIWRTMM